MNLNHLMIVISTEFLRIFFLLIDDHFLGNWNVKNNGLISMNSSSTNLSIQLSGLQRLSQLIINAGGTTHLTTDSLFVRPRSFDQENIVQLIFFFQALFILTWLS